MAPAPRRGDGAVRRRSAQSASALTVISSDADLAEGIDLRFLTWHDALVAVAEGGFENADALDKGSELARFH